MTTEGVTGLLKPLSSLACSLEHEGEEGQGISGLCQQVGQVVGGVKFTKFEKLSSSIIFVWFESQISFFSAINY